MTVFHWMYWVSKTARGKSWNRVEFKEFHWAVWLRPHSITNYHQIVLLGPRRRKKFALLRACPRTNLRPGWAQVCWWVPYGVDFGASKKTKKTPKFFKQVIVWISICLMHEFLLFESRILAQTKCGRWHFFFFRVDSDLGPALNVTHPSHWPSGRWPFSFWVFRHFCRFPGFRKPGNLETGNLLSNLVIGLFTVAIFRPFLAHFRVYGRETNLNKREWKMMWKTMWKMVTVKPSESKFRKNEAKMHFSLQAHCQKDE